MKVFNLFFMFVVFSSCWLVPLAAECIVVDDPLCGKRIAVIGDSYVRNHMEPIEYTWHYKLAKRHQMHYENYGINGNCISISRVSQGFGEPLCERFRQMPDLLDYVIVIAGHNDAWNLSSIGIDIFKEKLKILCEGLLDKYPKGKIFFFTCWGCKNFRGSNSEKIVDAILDICGQFAIPVFDAARNSNIYVASDKFREIYFQAKDDFAHLNALGHDRFLRCAEEFLLRY